ncbi:hypothetical protein [Ruegeria marina]|uniref:Lipoprotein n=1 Tax=Ruegeria marina TaxID=639004 RepID=A0A1G6IXS8_9RHOB|nr:hypothetical protein [Ruegeria marina]SDC11221.1 hypothetical protein SAMN04488239_101227 [Ruegeria marina]
MIDVHRILLLVPIAVAACTQDVAEMHTAARFRSEPLALAEGFESACSDPSESFLRPDRHTAQCWIYLPPDVTAALILAHDGTHENLPRLVLQMHTTPLPDGSYRVDLENFLNVPQNSGPARRIVYDDPGSRRSMARMLDELGGEPISN